MNAGLVKTSLVNFPGRVAAAVFLPGCNLRCPFCHNGALAQASVTAGPKSSDGSEYATIEEISAHLDKRAGVLGGIAISGGEPLLSPALVTLIDKAKNLGLAVKIDTNGTLPDRLKAILDSPDTKPDMVAIDVKTSPARYGELTIEEKTGSSAGDALLRSLAILSRERESLRVEYRTVLVPGLVREAEIREIAGIIPRDADWQLAPFVPGNCLSPAMNAIEPYGPAETERLLSVAKAFVPGAALR